MEDKELEQTILQRIRLFCDEDCWVDEVTLTEGFICPVMDCGKCFAKFGVLALIKEVGYVKLANDQTKPSFRNAVNKSYNDYMLGQEDMLKAGWRKVGV